MNVAIGLLGCGTVGAGVVELLARRQDKIVELTGLRPEIKKVLVRDLDKPRAVTLAPGQLTQNPDELLADEEIRIVVETIGGIEPARTYM
ncbi:MAG: homoserine dehydrogenase, partial [Alicyclobacillus sp.]|nr:homoserine dehydrogenase [Alicyclobacillus sp.]